MGVGRGCDVGEVWLVWSAAPNRGPVVDPSRGGWGWQPVRTLLGVFSTRERAEGFRVWLAEFGGPDGTDPPERRLVDGTCQSPAQKGGLPWSN